MPFLKELPLETQIEQLKTWIAHMQAEIASKPSPEHVDRAHASTHSRDSSDSTTGANCRAMEGAAAQWTKSRLKRSRDPVPVAARQPRRRPATETKLAMSQASSTHSIDTATGALERAAKTNTRTSRIQELLEGAPRRRITDDVYQTVAAFVEFAVEYLISRGNMMHKVTMARIRD